MSTNDEDRITKCRYCGEQYPQNTLDLCWACPECSRFRRGHEHTYAELVELWPEDKRNPHPRPETLTVMLFLEVEVPPERATEARDVLERHGHAINSLVIQPIVAMGGWPASCYATPVDERGKSMVWSTDSGSWVPNAYAHSARG